MVEDLYRNAMDGIAQKVAMQEIRKVIRGKKPEGVKLELIVAIVHSYEEDCERIMVEAERREMEAEEERERKEKISEMFEDMAAPLHNLVEFRKTKKDDGK